MTKTSNIIPVLLLIGGVIPLFNNPSTSKTQDPISKPESSSVVKYSVKKVELLDNSISIESSKPKAEDSVKSIIDSSVSIPVQAEPAAKTPVKPAPTEQVEPETVYDNLVDLSIQKTFKKVASKELSEAGENGWKLLAAICLQETNGNCKESRLGTQNVGCAYIRVLKRTVCEKSYGIFQINRDAHPKVQIDQAKDLEFAATWTAKRIPTTYACQLDKKRVATNFITCLASHNGQPAPKHYKEGITKWGIALGLPLK